MDKWCSKFTDGQDGVINKGVHTLPCQQILFQYVMNMSALIAVSLKALEEEFNLSQGTTETLLMPM